ncbi:MAG TPA: hypothetical protein VE973_01735 [Candidatus Limnocylindria bacterium]|nr:hypothetical protein [Candidatus Limnocylindria bacterium]
MAKYPTALDPWTDASSLLQGAVSNLSSVAECLDGHSDMATEVWALKERALLLQNRLHSETERKRHEFEQNVPTVTHKPDG